MAKQDYKQLKEIWYKKLKESGFRDIEYENKNGAFETVNLNPSYKHPQRFKALDYYLNCPLFIVNLMPIDYKYLDSLRFTGINRYTCQALGVNEQTGENIRRKYEEDWLYYFNWLQKQDEELDL